MTILTNPSYRPLLSIIRASRNGIVYGGKLRFSHALTINLLYRSGPIVPRIKEAFLAAKDHAEVLAVFSILYKSAQGILSLEKCMGRNNSHLIRFIAGCFASWVVYSQHFNFHPGITHQVTLYCFSRVAIAVGKILLDMILECAQPDSRRPNGSIIRFKDLTDSQEKKLKMRIYNRSWKYFAVLTWGLVMFIHGYQPQYLQSSLRHSMSYLYDVDVEKYDSFRELLGI